MRDFYASTNSMPLDQAHGLRRLFAGAAGPSRCVLPLVANPHLGATGAGSLVIDRVSARLAGLGRKVLVLDAAAASPQAPDVVRLDLAAAIQPLAPGVAWLPARGLALSYLDTRGSTARLLDALLQAAPGADVLLLHAEAADLARMLTRRSARPLVVGADHPEAIKHAYASAKLLMGRAGFGTFDLLLAASAHSPRIQGIVTSLAQTAESFFGGLLHDWVLIDPASARTENDTLGRLLAAQLELDSEHDPGPMPAPRTGSARRAAHR